MGIPLGRLPPLPGPSSEPELSLADRLPVGVAKPGFGARAGYLGLRSWGRADFLGVFGGSRCDLRIGDFVGCRSETLL